MTLTFCWDLSAADWIVHSDLPWTQLVSFGPAGFDSYARLRFLPDPVRPGQRENDAEPDGRPDQLPILCELLASHTARADDCFFCVWDGFGEARPAIGSQRRRDPSKVVVPNRGYWLFRGPLTDVGTWEHSQEWPYQWRLGRVEPAFIWPADHTWCVARDVDPHWAGIGGTSPLITRLLTDPQLDVVAADPTKDQPSYQ